MKQEAITISLIKNNNIEDNAGEQRMRKQLQSV